MLSEEHVQVIEAGRNILSALELHKRASFFHYYAKYEDLHVNEKSRGTDFLSYGPVTEKAAMNHGREITDAKFCLPLKRHIFRKRKL